MSEALHDLERRWENGLNARIGLLCALVRDCKCSVDELTEYRAYLVHARLIGFLSAQMSEEADEWVNDAERYLALRDCTVQ